MLLIALPYKTLQIESVGKVLLSARASRAARRGKSLSVRPSGSRQLPLLLDGHPSEMGRNLRGVLVAHATLLMSCQSPLLCGAGRGCRGRAGGRTRSWSEYMAHNECSVLPEGHCQIHGGGLRPSARWSPTQDRAVPQDVTRKLCTTRISCWNTPYALSTCVAASRQDFLRVARKKAVIVSPSRSKKEMPPPSSSRSAMMTKAKTTTTLSSE